MDTIDPKLRDEPRETPETSRAPKQEVLPPVSPRKEATRPPSQMACGMCGGSGKSLGPLAFALVAIVAIGGLAFVWSGGWSGGATAISAITGSSLLLFLLPCLIMGVGMMMMMGRNNNSADREKGDGDSRGR